MSQINHRACVPLFKASLFANELRGGMYGEGKWSPVQDNLAFLLQIKNNNNETNKKKYLLSTYHVPNTVQNTLHVLTNLMQSVHFTKER